jgi:hypothetical protein
MYIANPVYNVVFNYMMEDNTVAKKLISAIIGEEIIALDLVPTECTISTDEAVHEPFDVNTPQTPQTRTVCYCDFRAKIKVPQGYKTVHIELQKAHSATDIIHVRRYVGVNYQNPDNSYYKEDQTEQKALQVYCIFVLNNDAELIETPLLQSYQQVIDLESGKECTGRNEFIESLHDRSWIILIGSLTSRRRNDLEKLLSIFDQENRLSDRHILDIKEEDFPEAYAPIIRRLQKACETPDIMEQMNLEDDFIE